MIRKWSSIREYSPIAKENTLFTGRTELFTDEDIIDKNNIFSVLEENIFYIYENYVKIKMLKNYEKGFQPINNRDKKVRADINNKVVVNHAHEINEFKKGFIFGNPITYSQRAKENINTEASTAEEEERETDKGVAELNEMMFEQRKGAKDLKLADEFCKCGIGYRFVGANDNDDELSVFKIHPLKSETTFIIKLNDVSRKKVLGGTFIIKNTGNIILTCYTDKEYFKIEANGGKWKIVENRENGFGIIPIVEYKFNEDIQGCFEPVIPIMNAINITTSDRVNGISQFIQAILWINNIKLSNEQFDDLMVKGCLNTTDIKEDKKAHVEWLTSELNQSNTQTVIDDMTGVMLEIAGVPDRETASGGNTGQAIMLSNGWHIAETQAQAFEELFKESEQELLRVVLRIIKNSKKASKTIKSLVLSDIDINFNRNRTDNLLTKTQGLQEMLTAGVHPRIAFALCGLFSDSEQAYIDSEKYLKKWETEDISETPVDNDEEDLNIDNQLQEEKETVEIENAV